MTTEEKIRAMRVKCKGMNQWCDDCPLRNEDGCEFEVYDKARIDRLYSKMFPTATIKDSGEPTVIEAKDDMDYERAWWDAIRLNDELQFEVRQLKETIVKMCKSLYAHESGDAIPNELKKPRIIVGGKADKPFYEIMYYDNADREFHLGWGSYYLANVQQWMKENFGGDV